MLFEISSNELQCSFDKIEDVFKYEVKKTQ
jgi:hypothetical protein